MRAYTHGSRKLFANWHELTPSPQGGPALTIYVGAIPWIGIYIASALLIAGFMRWIGQYGWLLTLTISIALPVVTYVTL